MWSRRRLERQNTADLLRELATFMEDETLTQKRRKLIADLMRESARKIDAHERP